LNSGGAIFKKFLNIILLTISALQPYLYPASETVLWENRSDFLSIVIVLTLSVVLPLFIMNKVNSDQHGRSFNQPGFESTKVVLPGIVETDGLLIRKRVLPKPATGQVIVKVKASGLLPSL